MSVFRHAPSLFEMRVGHLQFVNSPFSLCLKQGPWRARLRIKMRLPSLSRAYKYLRPFLLTRSTILWKNLKFSIRDDEQYVLKYYRVTSMRT